MAQKVVLIADSEKGTLIDVAGNGRENGRYYKFAKRMLSTDTNPVLDFGSNSGDSLTVECNGGVGKEITLRAQTVSVTGDLKVGNKAISISELAAGQANALANLRGTDGEINVTKGVETAEDGTVTDVYKLSLNSDVAGNLEIMEGLLGGSAGYVKKSDLADALSGLSVQDSDTLDDVKYTLSDLLAKLGELADTEE